MDEGRMDSHQHEPSTSPSLQLVREKLANASGPEYWKSLEQVAETPEFQAWLEDEFPNRRSLADVDRRDFLKFMGASMMLAGLGGCRSLFLPSEKIVPQVKAPEDVIPGRYLHFATAMQFNGPGIGLLATSFEGRPIKIEGNPDHPASGGATDLFAQAAVLELYDPDRSNSVVNEGSVSTYELFLAATNPIWENMIAGGGAGMRVLTPSIYSPTLGRMLASLFAQFPNAQWVRYEPVSHDNAREGSRLAYGSEYNTYYKLGGAKVVVSLDADFMGSMPDSVRLAGEFMSRRHVTGTDTSQMNRLYVVESTVSLTGAMADHRLAVKPSQVESVAKALAAALGVDGISGAAPSGTDKWITALAADLQASPGECVVMAGPEASAATHALVHAINAKIGAVGATVVITEPIEFSTDNPPQTIQQLTEDLQNLRVPLLLVLGCNPVYDAPGELKFGEYFANCPLSIHHGLYRDETGSAATWHLNAAHFLETWGDVTAFDGTVSIQQPLIAPLYAGKSAIEFLSFILHKPISGMELVKETWRSPQRPNFEKDWQGWLNEGVVPNTKKAPVVVTPSADLAGSLPEPKKVQGGIEIAFRPDPTVFDGRFANLGWLQELPKAMTTLTWDNALLLSPATAESLKLGEEQWAEVTSAGRAVKVPIHITPGHPDGCGTLHLGGGRTKSGNVGTRTEANSGSGGFSVTPIRTVQNFWSIGADVKALKGKYALALTQTHHSMEGRGLVKAVTVEQFQSDPALKIHSFEPEPTISVQPDRPNDPDLPQWGMTIDLNLCTGCHACVAACQAENNIPVVGKTQVMRGREMHWIRIDRYYKVKSAEGSRDVQDQGLWPRTQKADVLDSANIETVFQPVTCMHCEKAPCEPVCPVAATVHSSEGLNSMIYNRCVGTRYCSNNCPYKVRRFNYLNYTDNQAQFMNRTEALNSLFSTEKSNGRALLKMANSPNVTVRGRGVMEKCTYCVQRLNDARIQAKRLGKSLHDLPVKTACQQACPTKAIVFGNIADPRSAVSQSKKEARGYNLLPELNTRNRTSYLARLRNPNKELENA